MHGDSTSQRKVMHLALTLHRRLSETPTRCIHRLTDSVTTDTLIFLFGPHTTNYPRHKPTWK